MRRSNFWRSAGIGAAVGAAGVYLFDPDRGRTRRAKLADQTGAMARKAGNRIRAQGRYQRGVAQGVIHKMGEPFRPEVEIDDATLLQKVKSEALGRWQGPKHDVVIDVSNGVVTLRGQASATRADELVDLIQSVEGVHTVTDQISVTQST